MGSNFEHSNGPNKISGLNKNNTNNALEGLPATDYASNMQKDLLDGELPNRKCLDLKLSKWGKPSQDQPKPPLIESEEYKQWLKFLKPLQSPQPVQHRSKWETYLEHLADQARQLDRGQMFKNRFSSPESHVKSLERTARVIIATQPAPICDDSGCMPASDPYLNMENVVRLSDTFKKATLSCLLFNNNNRISPISGNKKFESDITAVADECRDRLLRDRVAVLGAFGHVLTAESLMREPLGWRTGEKLNVEDAAQCEAWKRRCVAYIDKIMAALDEVEKQVKECIETGSWAVDVPMS